MRDTDESEKKRSPKLDNGGRELISAETLESAEELIADTLEKTTRLVRKHPIEAIAVTFGLGCLVGILVSRR